MYLKLRERKKKEEKKSIESRGRCGYRFRSVARTKVLGLYYYSEFENNDKSSVKRF